MLFSYTDDGICHAKSGDKYASLANLMKFLKAWILYFDNDKLVIDSKQPNDRNRLKFWNGYIDEKNDGEKEINKEFITLVQAWAGDGASPIIEKLGIVWKEKIR